MSREKRGVLIPPFYCHQPALIIGDRAYLEALKEAVEETLSGGISGVSVSMSDGKEHYLVVKLEEDTGKIPLCYGDLWGTKEVDGEPCAVVGHCFNIDEWGKAHELAADLEDFYLEWKRVKRGFTYLLLSLYVEKMKGVKTVEDRKKIHKEYSYLQKKLSSLFWDREQVRLANIKEFKDFMDTLYDTWGFPDYCFRLAYYGAPKEDVEKCVKLSFSLHEKGFPNKTLEAVGVVNTKDLSDTYFLFLIRDGATKKIAKELIEPDWILNGRRLYIPLKERA